MQWKGHLPAGKVVDTPVIALDILPTAVAAAGGTTTAGKPLDGVNLLPYLEAETKTPPHPALYWRFGQQWAIRKGNWKLLQTPDGGVRLFDLATDIGEKHDLAADNPDVVAELQKDYSAWSSELSEPKWQGRQRGANNKNKAKGKGKNKRKQAADN